MFLFKNYKYSLSATLLSLSGNLMIVCGFFAFFALMTIHVALGIIVGIFLMWAGAKVTVTLSEKYAKKHIDNKLRKNVKFCKTFCLENPDTYAAVAAKNPEFAARYVMGSDGKLKDRVR